MVLQVYNLDKRILIDDNSNETQNKELIAPSTDKSGESDQHVKKKLDLEFLAFVAQRISEKREYEDDAISMMLELSGQCKKMFFEVNMAIQDALDIVDEQITPAVPETFKMTMLASSMSTFGLLGSIGNIANNIKNAVSGAIKSVTDFAKSINPSNGLKALSNLVKFLMCPEQSFLADLTNAFNTIVNNVKSIKPMQLLDEALSELTKHIMDRFPTVNNLMNFFSLLSSVFMTDLDRNFVLNKVKELLGQNGLDLDYFNDSNVIDWAKDLLDPRSPINGGGKKPPFTLPNITPNKDATSGKCSALGKLIAQLEGSYRKGHKFDDLLTDLNYTKYMKDPILRNLIENLFSANKTAIDYYDTSLAVAKQGYHGNTALNSSMALAIENHSMLQDMHKELDNVGEDPLKFQASLINMNQGGQYLIRVNNVALQRLMAFEEGIKAVQRENKFYDVSKPMRNAINA